MRSKFLLIGALLVGLANELQAAPVPSLADYRSTYDRELGKIRTNNASVLAADADYQKALERLAAEYKQQGDFENTMALAAERKRFEAIRMVSDTPTNTLPVAVAAAQADYRAALARAESDKDMQIVKLNASYVKALKELIKTYLNADKMADAEDVNKEIHRIEAERKKVDEKPPATTDTTNVAGTPATHTAVEWHSDRKAFLAVVKNPVHIDFKSANTKSALSTDCSTAAGLSLHNVKFTGVYSDRFALSVIDPRNDAQHAGWTGEPTALGGPNDGYLEITLPTGTTAVGFDLYTASGSSPEPFAQDVLVTLSTGDAFTIPTFHKPKLAFAGFTSPKPITSVRIEIPTGTHNPNIASFVFAQ